MSARPSATQSIDSAARTIHAMATILRFAPALRRAIPKGSISRTATMASEDSNWLAPVGPPESGFIGRIDAGARGDVNEKWDSEQNAQGRPALPPRRQRSYARDAPVRDQGEDQKQPKRRSAAGNSTRAYPLQSRKSLPLECPESQENTPTPREADHTQSTGRHHFATGPRSAP